MGEAFPIKSGGATAEKPAQVAANWARAGFPVFPCRPQDKAPLTTGGFYEATTDLGAVTDFWHRFPKALVGIATGTPSGLFVIDLDLDKATGEAVGEASLAALGYSYLIGTVPTVATPSGGYHLYFKENGLGCTSSKLASKIDTRGDGGYIIAPGSVSPQGRYQLLNGPIAAETLTSVPEALLDRLRAITKPARDPIRIDTGQYAGGIADLSKADFPEVEEILASIPPDCGYFDWVGVLMGLHDHFAGSQAGLALADKWSAQGTKYKPGEVAAKWGGFTVGNGKGWGSVCNLARQHGVDLGAIAKRHRAQQKPPSATARRNATLAQGNEVFGHKTKPKETRVKWCADVACTILEESPDWAGVLSHDEFTGLDMLLKPIPGSTVPRSTFSPRPLTDNDFTAAVRWFNRNGFPDATKNGTADALLLVAGQTIISPVRHFLEGLAWDGVQRAGDWLTRYCGAEPADLTAKVGKAWLVAAVARALRPGCKADCALVLEGKQGAGKSSILRALAGDDWFSDSLRDMHGKDASAALRGKWIIELPELSAMRRSDTEAVKAFLSRTEERYRPAYGRTEVIEPRRCIFAGTTNRNDYLTDDTGGRRFWPVVVGAVDLDALTRDREQLWAEAVALYRAGEQWWLDRTDEGTAAAVVATRAADDPWAADVLRAVEGLSEVSTRDVFQLLEIPLDRRSKADAMRITGIITRAGWSRFGKFTSGPSRDLSRFLPPGGAGHV